MDLVELRFAGDLSRRTDPTLLYYSYSDTNARSLWLFRIKLGYITKIVPRLSLNDKNFESKLQ